MRTIHTEIGIGAPAEVVWGVVSDLDGWARWNPFMNVKGRLAAGEKLAVTLKAPGGKAVRLEPTVVQFDDGREFRWKVRAPAGLFAGEHGFRVMPEDVGRCRFEQFEMFSGLFAGAVLSRRRKALETGFEAMNRMLKREAEKRARERA